MAQGDLDAVIRQLARQQQKTLLAAAKARRDRFNALAAKARDKESRERHRAIARLVMEHASAAARRLQLSADNAADSYARSMRQAEAEADAAAAKRAEKKPVAKRSAKQSKK